MEQIPQDIDFGDVSILIAGFEISSSEMLRALIEHGDPAYYASAETRPGSWPQPQPEPDPEPELRTRNRIPNQNPNQNPNQSLNQNRCRILPKILSL
jgi:hypothetical protein